MHIDNRIFTPIHIFRYFCISDIDGGACVVRNCDGSSSPRVNDLVFAFRGLLPSSSDMIRTASP